MNIQNENIFIFTMNGLIEDNIDINISANNRWLYCICMKCVEPLYSANETTIAGEKVYCFMTYNNFVEFFIQALNFIRNTLKFTRQTIATNLDEIEENIEMQVKKQIDAYIQEPYISMEGKEVLKNLYYQDIGAKNKLKINTQDISFGCYEYVIPDYLDLRKAVANCFCPVLFSSLKLQVLYEVLTNVFTERSIIFVSQNLNLLTSASYS